MYITKQLGREPQKAREMSICYPQIMVMGHFTCMGPKEPATVHKTFKYVHT